MQDKPNNKDHMRKYFLTTERIKFSYWTENDFELAKLLWGDAEVTHYISASGIFTETQIRDRLKLEIENLEKYKVQYFPFFHRQRGELTGCCGLRPYRNKAGTLELGFHLRKKFWKQGLAFEAADAMIHYGANVIHATELKAGHHPQNSASEKLLKQLGFIFEGEEFYGPTGLFHPNYYLPLNQKY